MRCYFLLYGAHFILIGTKTDNFYFLDNEQYVFYNIFDVIILKYITLQYFLFENISKYFGKTFVIFAINFKIYQSQDVVLCTKNTKAIDLISNM